MESLKWIIATLLALDAVTTWMILRPGGVRETFWHILWMNEKGGRLLVMAYFAAMIGVVLCF